MMPRPSSLAPLLLLSLSLGCGNNDEPAERSDASVGDGDGGVPLDATTSDASDAGQSCRTYVSDSLIQHACFHELMGPYAERTASASANDPGIDLNRAHTSFRVRLPARAQGGFGGVLTYEARSAGAYAIFARNAEVRLSAQGMPLVPTFAHDTQVCALLPAVSTYNLSAQTYTLVVSSTQPDVVLVVESMDEGTVADAYRIECTNGPRASRDAAVFTLDAALASDAAAAPHDGTLPDGEGGTIAAASDAGSTPLIDAAVRSPEDAATASKIDAAASDSDSDAGANDGGICLLDPVLEHACLHAMQGPFEAVSALDTVASTPDISRPHTAWRMALPAGASGRFVFRPNLEGEYVFYLDRPLPLAVSSGGSAVMPIFLEPVSGCVDVSEARVFPLTRGTRYDVVVGPVAGDAATLIIENVQAFTSAWSGRFEPCS